MSRRVCPKPGCPNFQPCDLHSRPNSNARGYGRRHRQTRTDWAPSVEAGQVDCWRCGERIRPGEPWDLGHDDDDRSVTRGPEHAGRCNRAEAGRRSHSV